MAVCHLNIASSCESCLYCVCVAARSLISNVNRTSMHALFYFCSLLLMICRLEWSALFATFGTAWHPLNIFEPICRNQTGCFSPKTRKCTHTHAPKWTLLHSRGCLETEKREHSMDQTWDQKGWSASFCLLIALIYFLPPVDSKESCLGPFREIIRAKNKVRKRASEWVREREIDR